MEFPEIAKRFDYVIIVFLAAALLAGWLFPVTLPFLWIGVLAGTLPTCLGAIRAAFRRRISIDTFNLFALAVAILYGQASTAAFIVLMLAFARLLQERTESRTRRTIAELLKLKPERAFLAADGTVREIDTASIVKGNVLVAKEGYRIPVDGVVVAGRALVNEASVTGESLPTEKVTGDEVLSATLIESGLIQIKATRVGSDSTIERMVRLVEEASRHKSRSEKIADRFSTIFLPIVVLLGLAAYFLTRNLEMVAALFLIACADDMAVAIPLAVMASLGNAARRGVVVKGGEYIELLASAKAVVIDKTGTLTYGTFAVTRVRREEGVDERGFWNLVGTAEKFSEHPIGRTMYKEALKKAGGIADPEEFLVKKGSGIQARVQGEVISIGDLSILETLTEPLPAEEKSRVSEILKASDATCSVVLRGNRVMGFVYVGDVTRKEAQESIALLKEMGVRDIRMFTGDNPAAAQKVAGTLGIDSVRSGMLPEDKVREIERLAAAVAPVIMVGDGINDAAALARADVGVAMGAAGAAVTVEAADMVILQDDLSLLPYMVSYARRVMSVIHWDVAIWVASNAIGFLLVLTGFAGPAFAAFYNFFTDFFPLLNSTRLFRKK